MQLGEAPYLECSSKGDKRFSAFYAKLKLYGGKSIEEVYQASKIFEDGKTNLTWREAKGKKPINVEYCKEYYSYLWKLYIWENSALLQILKQASGLSDVFGQKDHCCQAVELWNIRNQI